MERQLVQQAQQGDQDAFDQLVGQMVDRLLLFMPERVAGETTGAYQIGIGDRTLCVYLTWDAGTTPAELDAVRRMIDSIRAQPFGADGIRIVFTLQAGWDTG